MRRPVWVLPAILVLGVGAAQAIHLKVSLSELSQTADLIFIGTVTGQSTRLSATKTMPVTDVVFADIEVVHATARSTQRDATSVTLTYAGGRLGETTVNVSDTPRFVDGHRYLVFALDDGSSYFTPIVGGSQGQFEVVADTVTGVPYVLTASGRALVGIAGDDVLASPSRVRAVENGVAVAERAAAEPRKAGAPGAAGPGDSYRASTPHDPAPPLRLSAFLDYVRTVALTAKIDASRLRRGGVGRFHRREDGRVVVEPLPESPPPVRPQLSDDGTPLSVTAAPGESSAPDMSVEPLGAALYCCGKQGPPAVMEQVPTSWWEWSVNNASMARWNRVMNVFRYVADDGSWRWYNWDSEFIGYPSSATMLDVFGQGWGPTDLAITWTWHYCDCCEVKESDIAWNPAFDWTDDFGLSLGDSSLVLQPGATIHELGHAIGFQIFHGETYDYDVPTVMHSYHHDLVEDAAAVHQEDAYLMRRNYDDDLAIPGFADLGVESYYASNGLHNATASAATFRPGDPITVSHVTVENMSYGAQADVRLRLYLSTNKTITTADRQMGSYWYWSSFCGECYDLGDYTTTIPASTPPGTYYVGLIVTRNGFGDDDEPGNNRTFLYQTIEVTCDDAITLSPAAHSVPRTGEIARVSLSSTGTACPWTATDDRSWVTITAGASGTGSGNIAYRVEPNTVTTSRTAHIVAGDRIHTITQEAGCLTSVTNPIAMWGSASGWLSAGDCLSSLREVPGTGFRPYADRYTFSGTAGQQVAILATSTEIDGYLYLLGPSGEVIASDNEGGGSHNPRIPAGSDYLTLPSTGTYTVELTTEGIDTGAYTLRLLGRLTLTVTPTTGVVTGCLAAKGRLELGSSAPAGGLTVKISDTLAGASPPLLVTVAQSTNVKAFTIPTTPVASTQAGTITASVGGVGGVSSSEDLSIRPISVKTLTLSPNPVVGPAMSIGSIVLECNAGPDAITVNLTTSKPAVAWPAVTAITFYPGNRSASFGVRTADVLAVSSATIRATANGRSKSQKLVVQ